MTNDLIRKNGILDGCDLSHHMSSVNEALAFGL